MFVRRDGVPAENHALWVANPPAGRALPGPPADWPPPKRWEAGFDLTRADERYAERNPYDPPTHASCAHLGIDPADNLDDLDDEDRRLFTTTTEEGDPRGLTNDP